MARPTTAAVRELAGFKEPCLVATTANIDIASGTLLTIDGVTVAAGDRVLVKNQTDGSENGIYLASEGEWYRAPDAMSSRNINKGILVWVQAGSTQAGLVYSFDTLDPDIGTDDIDIVLTEMSGGGGAPLAYATAADVRASASGQKIITADLIEGASALVALTDEASIAFDWDAGLCRTVTLGGNRTLANPTNGQPGTWRTVLITQDGVGGRTLSFGNQYRFTQGVAPTFSAAPGAVDALSVFCITPTDFMVWFALNMLVP